MKKRCFSLLLLLTLCLGLMAPAALADGEFQVTDGVLTKYTGSGGDVVIPSGVVGIGKEAFDYKTGMTSVTIPDGVGSIGAFAFCNCTGLTEVTIPGSVATIDTKAFLSCSNLTSLTLCDGVGNIGKNAFDGCSKLTQVTIPGSVEGIGMWAFRNCSALTEVTICDGVTAIGELAFSGCKSLSTVTIPASVERIDATPFTSRIPTIQGAEGSYAQLWAQSQGYSFVATLPAATTPGRTAYASTQNILVNGVPVEFQAYALKDKNGNPTNYVKLRDVASVLNGTSAQSQVGWDGMVTVTTGSAYTPVGSEMTTPYSGDQTYFKAGKDSVLLNGRDRNMLSLLLKDSDGNGYTYFKLRDLGEALGFRVDWTAEKGIFIETL